MINLRIGDKVSGQVVKSVRVGYVIDINAPSEALLPKENFGKKQPKLCLGDQVQDLIVIDVDHAARGYEKIILSGKDMVKLWPMSPDRSPQTLSPQMSPGAGTRTPPEYHGVGARAMAPPLPGARPPGDPPPPRGAQSPASQASEDEQPSWAMHLFRDNPANERPHSAPMPTANTKIARAREAEEQRSADWRPAPPDFLLAQARRGGAAMPSASEGRGALQPNGARGGMDSGRGGAKRAQRGAMEEDAEEELSAPVRPPQVPAMPSGQGWHSPPQSPPSEAQEERSMRRWPQVPDDRSHRLRSQHTRPSPPMSPELMSENDVETVGIGYYTEHLDFDIHRGPSRQGGRSSRDASQRQAAGRRRWEGSSPSSALQSPQGGSPRGSYEGVPYPAGQGVQTPVTIQIVRELRRTLLETAKEVGIPLRLLGKVLEAITSMLESEDLEEPLEQKIAERARKGAAWASRPSSSSARARGSTSARAEPRPRSSHSATGQGAEGNSSRCATPAPKRVASAPGLMPGSAPMAGRQRSQQVQPQQGRVGPRGGRRSAHDGPADAGGGAVGRQAGKVRTARAREPPREQRGQPRDSRERESREWESELLERLYSFTNESGTPVNDLSVGAEANGTVVEIVPNLGIFFDVGAQKLGKMLQRSMGRDLPQDLRINDKVEGLRIDSVDKANQRFTLSGEGVEFGEPIYLRKEVERARLQGAKRHALH